MCGVHEEKEIYLVKSLIAVKEDNESNNTNCSKFTRQTYIKQTMAFANKSYFEDST